MYCSELHGVDNFKVQNLLLDHNAEMHVVSDVVEWLSLHLCLLLTGSINCSVFSLTTDGLNVSVTEGFSGLRIKTTKGYLWCEEIEVLSDYGNAVKLGYNVIKWTKWIVSL